ncbi:survival motor neuron protein 1-like isoform X1 [Calonectris borealis]|uniref:survival motor neuron protein 1-like isoform X1 n=1 Tax=Calonectris borealis TaxID=1323832 RepID=UPI003F4B8FC0
MAESAPGPRVGTGTGPRGLDRWGTGLGELRGPDRAGPDAVLPPAAGGPSSGKAATPGAAPLRSPRTSFPRDAPGEGSDGDSETPTSSVTPSEEEEEEEGHQWRVGDACSTAWAGDGLLYPARLRALDPAAGTCLVEFDGYGNTEERALADLLPPHPGTWGASDTPRGEGPRAEPRRPSTPSSWELPPGARRRKGERTPCSPQPPEVMPPLWPPASLRAMREVEEEEDALAAMLMAWYMSGYHTGFYVGLREGRTEAAEPPPPPGRRQKKPPHS